MKKDYVAIAKQYALDVVEKKIPACEWVILACQRQLDDLERAAKGWDYIFNPELTDNKGKKYFPAERICRFVEMLPHVKGVWAARRELISLEPWQIFIYTTAYGWITASSGYRRFWFVDVYIPRKNTKSTMGAGSGLYGLTCDNEYGAEVYSGATTKEQALKIFKPARDMSIASPDFRSAFGVIPNISNLAVLDTNSKFIPMIGKPGDGDSPSTALIDEYHEHETSEQYDTMETGMGARSQPMLWVYTTAGNNISSPCYQHQNSLQKILRGVIKNERRFGIIYTIDKDDKWDSDEALIKANPNLGISVDSDYVKTLRLNALSDPRKQSTFKTKHLNVWVNSQSPWVNLENLQRAGDPSLRLEDFYGECCFVGMDLASKKDIASFVIEFVREINGENHYYAFSFNYLPQKTIDLPENAHYRGWKEQGYLRATPGGMISLRKIEQDLLDITDDFRVTEMPVDAWMTRELTPSLEENGFTLVDVPQKARYLSEPMKDLDALIDDGRFHHDGNPVFVWAMSNVEVRDGPNEIYFPNKNSKEKKIDPAVALIVSHNRAMLRPAEEQLAEIINL